MNNLQEITDFINAIPLGEPVYKINSKYLDEIGIELENWTAKEELRKTNDFIKSTIGKWIRRGFNKTNKEMVLINADSVLDEIRGGIIRMVRELVIRTSPADRPKRTKVYKEINEISYEERSNVNFINDLIPIINYYYSHVELATESTDIHKKNIFGLINILRKKYGNN